MRTVTIPSVDVAEEICRIEHSPGSHVRFLVGKGQEIAGKFVFDMPQQFHVFDIRDGLYAEFIAAHPNFTSDDLWAYVDLFRSGSAFQRPSANYDWNGESWTPNIIRAVATAKANIAAKLEQLKSAPILYGGRMIDVDMESRENIQGKLNSILCAEALNGTVTECIWRDTANNTITFESLEAYKSWLQGLVLAVAERTTALYQASWAHKAAIDNLAAGEDPASVVAAIEGYDVGTNWPA